MGFSKYKKLVVRDGDTISYLLDKNNIPLTSNELIDGYIPIEELKHVLRSNISKRFFKLYLLHDDESIKEDITEQVVLGGALTKIYQQGSIRSLSITLQNPTNIWNPSPISGKLWTNSKFRLDMGVTLGNEIYWFQEGIFVVQDPTLDNNDSNKTVSLQLFDKFALLDGTIDGNTDSEYKIPVGASIYEAIRTLLRLEKDKLGNIYDEKTLIFPSKYMDKVTPHTISKTSTDTIGSIIIDLANMLSCDVFYNEFGHLTIKDNIEDLDLHNRQVVWEYDSTQLEVTNVSMKIEWSKIRNKFLVTGANMNGVLLKGIAENTNLRSVYNVYGTFGIKADTINDDLINSPDFCEERAKYELKKNAMRNISISFNSIYLPHISPNDLIRWTWKDYNIINEELVVQNIDIPLDSNELISISATNIKELPL